MIFNQAIEPIATGPATLVAGDIHYGELAGEVAEYDCVVAGHGRMDGDQTASLSSLLARKATFLLALIWIGSPVSGLRPMQAARFLTCRGFSMPARSMPRICLFGALWA